jgi:DNA-binding CsgD family transcriptional regulator
LARAALGGSGFDVFEGLGIREGGCAYGPMVEVVRAIFASSPAAATTIAPALLTQLAVLVPEVAPSASDVDRATLFEAIRAAVALAASERPVAIFLDDMQWADHATFDLVAWLARSLEDAPVLLLVAYRSDDLSRGHGLRRLRSELRRRRTLEEIAVEPIAPAAVAALLERTLGATVAPSLCDLVFDRTDGVPFFVTELGLALAVGERLGVGPSGLELADGADLPLPESVRDAVLLRASDLTVGCRAALSVAAVAGLSFDVESVTEITGVDDWSDDPVLAGVLIQGTGGRMAFRHALVRDAFYGEVPWLLRRKLHRQVAERLEASDAPARIVAEHWASAGESDRARRSFLAAAAGFCAVHAYRDGVRAARKALELWADVDGEDDRLEALEALARCAELAGEPQEAVGAWRDIVETRRNSEPQLFGEASRRLAGSLEAQGRWEEALAAREDAARAFSSAGATGDAAAERLAAATHLRSAASFRAALPLLEIAGRDARAAGRVDLVARILGLEGNVRARMGDGPVGLDLVRAALSLALEHNLVAPAGEVYQRLADSLEHVGDYRAASATYDDAFAFCATAGLEPTAQVCRACLAAVLRQTGDWERAVPLCREVLASPEATQHARGAAAGTLGTILAMRGDARSARALLLESQSIARSIELIAMEVISAWGLALLDWATDAPLAAAERCHTMLQRWRHSEERHYSVPPLRWAAGLFAECGDATGAHACAAALAQIAADSGQAEAASALAHALGEIASLQGEREQAAGHYARAIELLDGVTAPFELMETQRRAAVALIGTDRRDEAVEHLLGAYRIARRLKSRLYTQRLATSLAELGEQADRRLSRRQVEQLGHEGLTRRELDIVRLVAIGWTNREIARELFVSVRTVDMHVRNTLRKLNCRSRADAARRASELGLVGDRVHRGGTTTEIR